MKRMKLVLGCAVLALALAACGGDGDSNGGPADTPTPAGVEVFVQLTEWAIEPTIAQAGAGDVTFSVHNAGQIPHELVVIKTDLPVGELPVENGLVVEEGIGEIIGEIEPEDLASGQTSHATWNLEAGAYALICNIAGHYQAGMFTEFTVN